MSDLTIDPAATDIDVARARLFEAAMAEAGHPVELDEVVPDGWFAFPPESRDVTLMWRASQIAFKGYPAGDPFCLACFLANTVRRSELPCEAIAPFTDDCGIDRGES